MSSVRPPGERGALPEPPLGGDAEDVLALVLDPGERVLWAGEPDRPAWRRALTWGLGCLPFTLLLVLLLGGTIASGTVATRRAATGQLRLQDGLQAGLGVLLLVIFVFPLVANEISRRERRYVVTTRRALIVSPRRLEAGLELLHVQGAAAHRGLFDDRPSGVALRVRNGAAPIVFEDLADPEAVLATLTAILARGGPPSDPGSPAARSGDPPAHPET